MKRLLHMKWDLPNRWSACSRIAISESYFCCGTFLSRVATYATAQRRQFPFFLSVLISRIKSLFFYEFQFNSIELIVPSVSFYRYLFLCCLPFLVVVHLPRSLNLISSCLFSFALHLCILSFILFDLSVLVVVCSYFNLQQWKNREDLRAQCKHSHSFVATLRHRQTSILAAVRMCAYVCKRTI